MRAYIIVLLNKVRNILPEFFGAVIFINVDFFRIERAEPSLNHDVVRPLGLAVHTLTNVLAFKIGFIFFAGKLTVLVTVHDGGTSYVATASFTAARVETVSRVFDRFQPTILIAK